MPNHSAQILAALNESPLTKVLSERLIDKAMCCMNQLGNVDEIPSLVHQLLSFGCAMGHREKVMMGICNRLGRYQTQSLESTTNEQYEKLRRVKGTVLFHIDYGVKQDVKLGTSFIKSARWDELSISHGNDGFFQLQSPWIRKRRSSPPQYTPFHMIVALTIARNEHIEEKALNHLISSFKEVYRNERAR